MERIKHRRSIHSDENYKARMDLWECYSDESETEDCTSFSGIGQTNNSQHSTSSISISSKRGDTSSRTSSPIRGKRLESYSPDKFSDSEMGQEATFPLMKFVFPMAAVAIMICLFGSLFVGIIQDVTPPRRPCTYSNLKSKYPLETNKLWRQLEIGVENILNDDSESPAVYLFVHNGGHVPRALIKDIARQSSRCFGSSMEPVEMETIDFTSDEALQDYGYIIEVCKQRVKQGNVILIANLNDIPAEVAKALHFICDTYNPLVPKVVILLSLVTENRKETVIETAREALLALWDGKIGENDLGPLITRVTDQVILLKST